MERPRTSEPLLEATKGQAQTSSPRLYSPVLPRGELNKWNATEFHGLRHVVAKASNVLKGMLTDSVIFLEITREYFPQRVSPGYMQDVPGPAGSWHHS